MDKIFRDINCGFVYIDNILFLSYDEIYHQIDIVFNVTSQIFLGLQISADGIKLSCGQVEELKCSRNDL